MDGKRTMAMRKRTIEVNVDGVECAAPRSGETRSRDLFCWTCELEKSVEHSSCYQAGAASDLSLLFGKARDIFFV